MAQPAAEVIVLTEYRENESSGPFKTRLFALGYKWQAASSVNPKENAVFLASKTPFVSNGLLRDSGIERHRLLFAQFAHFNLIGVYFPQKEAKRPVFDYLVNNAQHLLGDAGLVIGDLNTGKHFVDEAGKTFACADCIEDLESVGLVDAWRSRNPGVFEFSWYSNAKNGFRIDHVFCTPQLNQTVTKISYVHDPREAAATDHSALVVEFDCSTFPRPGVPLVADELSGHK